MLVWLLTGVLVYEAILRIRDPEEVDGRLMFFVSLAGLCMSTMLPHSSLHQQNDKHLFDVCARCLSWIVVNLGMGWILHQAGHAHSHGLGGGKFHISLHFFFNFDPICFSLPHNRGMCTWSFAFACTTI
jgi:Co/Zn/Cd efflux system component